MNKVVDTLIKEGTGVAKEYVSQGLALMAILKWSILAISVAVIGGIGYAIFS